MAPVILESKSGGLLVIGGSGGSMITTAVALVTKVNSVCILFCLLPCLFAYIIHLVFLQSIINRLWLGMSLKDAIAAPTLFVDSNNDVNFEPGFDKVRYSCSHPRCPLMTFKFTRL